jgi:circadian clock protein KaiC
MASAKSIKRQPAGISKARTGIEGVDEITGGGLPRGRTSLVYGGAGSGKTLFAMEFLVNGATRFNEPGVFVSFEESSQELTENVVSLGFDLKDLTAKKKIVMDHVQVERSDIEETGEYDLEGLFIRLGYAIDSVGAKRVVLDTLEALFSAIPNRAILRAELRRLFGWLKKKRVTAVVTAERGDGALTRFGLEEYVADCVIFLDHRIMDQVSTRRMRIIKYRGSEHGTNEYPFLISHRGISVLPITAIALNHEASNKRVSTGIPGLDAMLGGKGFFRNSTILVSGPAGSGKSSIAASFVDAACKRGEKCVYFAFEESPSQIIRNMSSIGIDLRPHVKSGLLQIMSARPTLFGLEQHLASMYETIRDSKPAIVAVDPITDFMVVGTPTQIKAAMTLLIDFLKSSHATGLFTSLAPDTLDPDQSTAGVSSMIDTWIALRTVERDGRRTRGLHVLKSRGMPHSKQIRFYDLTDEGVLVAEPDRDAQPGSSTGPHDGSQQSTQADKLNRQETQGAHIDSD